MKYIITENKMDNMIKDYILKNYDYVYDVDFGTNRTHLGSGPNEKGETVVEQKVIMITFNNLDNKPIGELRKTTRDIAKTLENFFGIDWRNYGSEWDIKFYQIKRIEL